MSQLPWVKKPNRLAIFYFIQAMVTPEASERPSALNVIQHPAVCPNSKKSYTQLKKELNVAKFQNAVLSR